MSITRVVVPPASLRLGEVTLDDDAAHHARVARVRAGEAIELLDLAGVVGVGWVVAWEGKRCRVLVEALLAEQGEPPEPLVLGLGLLHTAAFDWAVEKAVELGVTSLVPVVSSRVQGRLARPRPERWRRIAAAAAAQCGRSRVPELMPPTPLSAFLRGATGLRLVAEPAAPRGNGELATGGGGLTVLVGPEGGLTAEEVAEAVSAGFVPLGLGPRTLRAETAAVAALAVAQQRAGWI